jgi:hypothetical protein
MDNIEYCTFCGSSVESGSQFCKNCGASLVKEVEKTPTHVTQIIITPDTAVYQSPAIVYVPQSQGTSDSLGTIALILGITSFCIFPLLSIPAVITGHIARSGTKS